MKIIQIGFSILHTNYTINRKWKAKLSKYIYIKIYRPLPSSNSEFSTICTIQYPATAVEVCEYPLSFFASRKEDMMIYIDIHGIEIADMI